MKGRSCVTTVRSNSLSQPARRQREQQQFFLQLRLAPTTTTTTTLSVLDDTTTTTTILTVQDQDDKTTPKDFEPLRVESEPNEFLAMTTTASVYFIYSFVFYLISTEASAVDEDGNDFYFKYV